MKKKLLIAGMILVLAFCFAGCGGEDASSDEGTTVETEAPKVEKTVDAVAAELGLQNKQEKAYEMVGAIDGAGYDGGVELYLYDEDSEAYDAVIGDGYDMDGLAIIKANAYNDGMVLIFSTDIEPDQELIDAFNALSLK